MLSGNNLDTLDEIEKENGDIMSSIVSELENTLPTKDLFFSEIRVNNDPKNQRCIIVDMDGTLSDCRHRLHHLTEEPKSWEKFFEDTPNDPPHEWCVRLVQLYYQTGFNVFIVSARPEKYRGMTLDWLTKYDVPFNELFMRKNNDYREDSIVKEEILAARFPDKTLIEFVVDDRPTVVEMWRRNNLMCLQVNPHTF